MAQKSICLTANFTTKPGKEQQVKEILLSLIQPSLQEPGCLNYTLHQHEDEPTQFMFYENWQSEETLAEHSKSQHVLAMRNKLDGLLAADVVLKKWHKC